MQCNLKDDVAKLNSREYEFLLFDSVSSMVEEIKKRNVENGLSRMIAGYSWEWISKHDRTKFDINIDNVQLAWNSSSDDWINSVNSVNEVGCIHTTQGYDLNYAGIIFGNEISYDFEKNEIVVYKENYHDKNGKSSIKDLNELKSFIINIYKTIMLRGIRGTYVYACDKNLRRYFSKHIPLFRDSNTKSVDVAVLAKPYINSIPFYNLKAAAGSFSMEQIIEEYYDDVEWIVLPSEIRISNDLFACTVTGESMNKIIPNGSVCLFRKDSGGSRDGKIVLAQHTSIQDGDFGSGYTVKEYHSKKFADG